jgi:hypothetical protein
MNRDFYEITINYEMIAYKRVFVVVLCPLVHRPKIVHPPKEMFIKR